MTIHVNGLLSYTLPDGLALLDLVPDLGSGTQKLARTSLDGSGRVHLPHGLSRNGRFAVVINHSSNGSLTVETLDGTEIVMAEANFGTSARVEWRLAHPELVTPGSASSPPAEMRQWVVLASCNGVYACRFYWLHRWYEAMLFASVGWDLRPLEGGRGGRQRSCSRPSRGNVSIVRFARWRCRHVPIVLGDTSGHAMIVSGFGDELELEVGEDGQRGRT